MRCCFRHGRPGPRVEEPGGFDPGIDPAIRAFKHPVMREAWVYIMTNRPNGTLYVGVTTNLLRRTWEHREGVIEGFTKKYGLKRLVYYERHESIVVAIQREKNFKHWPRAWKVSLILDYNPGWVDLYESLQ
jgi:putative endonuclease